MTPLVGLHVLAFQPQGSSALLVLVEQKSDALNAGDGLSLEVREFVGEIMPPDFG
jgi:hypothetical protein